MHDTVKIIFLGSSRIDQEMVEVDSNLESMLDDEIISIFGNDNDDDDDDDSKELSEVDEIVANNVIAKLNNIANTMDANTNVAAPNTPELDPLGHLQKGLDSLATQVDNLESSLSQKLADKIDSSVPQMIADAFETRMPDLLSDTLKNILLQLLNDSIKKLMPKFDKRVKKTLKAEVLDVVLKPLNKEFNMLNMLES
ncbi:hypothetical protein Tco_0065256 [Tanacetum coccineum]